MKKIAVLVVLAALLVGCSTSTKKKKAVHEDEIVVKVTDLSAPVITVSQDAFEIELGEKFEIKDHIQVEDNVDKKVKYTINGTYDTKKAGVYKLKIRAKDKAGNVANKEISIVVKEKVKEVPKEVMPNVPSPQTPQNEINTPNVLPPQPPYVPSGPRPANANFLFSEGYTMPGGANPADRACAAYLTSKKGWAGSCSGVYDGNGMPIGSQAIFE